MKPTVLYLSSTYEGGAVFSLLNMISALHERIKPIVLFPDRDGVYERFVKVGVECIVVPFREEIFYKDRFQAFDAKTKCAFVACKLRDYARWNLPFNSRVKKQLGGRRIDIVHTNSGAIDLGVSLARNLGAKHVWHLREFQDKDFHARPFFGWKRFYRKLHQSDEAIGITHAIASHFGIKTFVWNAVKPQAEVEYVKEKGGYIFFVAASISPAKGLHDLVEAYVMSALPNKGIRLVVAGEFSDERYKKQVMEQCSDIEFIGFCNDVKPYMLRANAVVMPSLNEAMGRVAIEAMFYGAPAVTRNTGGPAEFMQDGINGYTFDSVPRLAEILNHVCLHDNEQLIQRAQRFAIDNFSEEVYGMRIYEIYKSLCQTR